MTNDYLVIHTPGAFGNFLAYLIDCHQHKTLLPSPFIKSGASHARIRYTTSFDMVIPGLWEELRQQSVGKKLIGCVWQQEYFTYILHAYYSRTNGGQYGSCGLECAEKDFYNFVIKHKAVERVKQNIVDLKNLFNLEITEKNTQAPRYILRMFFWFAIFNQLENIVTITNQQIKLLPDILTIDIQDIIDYKKLKKIFLKEFSVELDFQQLHNEFLERNRSLQDYIKANSIIESIKNNKPMEIEGLSVIGEATVLYELEKYYFDIPFFNLVEFFKNTSEIINYIKHFPNFMKQPNKLYHQYDKRFPNPYTKK